MKSRLLLLLIATGLFSAVLVWRSTLAVPEARLVALEPQPAPQAEASSPTPSLAQQPVLDSAPAVLPELDHEGSQTTRVAELEKPLYRLFGSVTSEGAGRFRKCQVHLLEELPSDGTARRRKRAGFTRSVPLRRDGTFAVNVPRPGRYHVWATVSYPRRHSPGATTSQVLTTTLSSSHTSAELRLVVGTNLAIEGRVVDPQGRPIVGALLRLGRAPVAQVGGRQSLRGGGQRLSSETFFTGKHGEFRIYPLHPDTPPLRVEVQLKEQHLAQVLGERPKGNLKVLELFEVLELVPGATDVLICVDPDSLRGASLTVEVLMLNGGKRPASVSYNLTRVDESGAKLDKLLSTHPLGDSASFTIEGLEPGARYTLQLINGNYNTSELFGPFRATRGGALAQLALQPAVLLKLKALAPRGHKLKDAEFTVQPLAAYLEAQAEPTATKKQKRRRRPRLGPRESKCPGGRTRLGPGEYVVRARWKRWSLEQRIQVGQEDLEVVLNLGPANHTGKR